MLHSARWTSAVTRPARMGLLALSVALLLVAAASAMHEPAAAQTPTATPPAGTRCAVAPNTVVPCDDPGITDAHAPNCAFLHYHGVLNGVADPQPEGCGHGEVVSLAPEPTGWWDTVTDWLDVVAQALTTGFSPKSVYQSVETVEDAAPSMAESAENAEEYFEVYPDAPDRPRYTLKDEDPEGQGKSWVYNWFWSFFE